MGLLESGKLSQHSVVSVPTWLQTFMDDIVLPCVTPLGFIGHITFCYWPPEDLRNPSNNWLVVAYPAANVIRAAHSKDGAVYVTGFYFDVHKLLRSFTAVHEIAWRSPVVVTGQLDGPEIMVRGIYAEHQVQLRFFHLPPPDESPAYAVNPNKDEVQRL